MTMTEELPLNMLIIGPPKAGKSWMSATTPPPRLMIDLEGRSRYTPAGKDAIFWNGEDDPMTLGKSPSRTYILQTTDLAKLDVARQWLRTGKHPFKSVSLDSVMELRYLVIQHLKPGVIDIPRQDWGPINKTFETNLRDLRNLTDSDDKGPTKCVLFISGAEIEIETGHIKPIVKGEVGKLVPYWMDVVAYQEAITAKGGGTPYREMHIAQRAKNDLEVGDATDRIVTKLGSPIKDGSIQLLFDTLQGKSDDTK